MVGNVEFIVVNRHSFVRGGPARVPPQALRDQNDPFSSVPGGSFGGANHEIGPSTTFDSIPPTIPLFSRKLQAFYLRFCFRVFGMVGGKGLNVVDGPISWRPFLPCAQKCRHGEGRRLRGGWGWGGVGLCSGSPPAARGLLAPGAASVPSAYGYPRPGLRRRPWQ